MPTQRISLSRHEAALAAVRAEYEEKLRIAFLHESEALNRLREAVGVCESVSEDGWGCERERGHDTARYPHQRSVHKGGNRVMFLSW